MPAHIDFEGYKYFLVALLMIGVYPKLYRKAKLKFQRWYFTRYLDTGGRYALRNERLLNKPTTTTGSYLFPDERSDLHNMQVGRN